MKKRVSIVTLGCPKNEVDSWIMENYLKKRGYTIVSPEEAEIVIINTCGFIESAKEESIETIFDFVNAGKRVYVAGCLYQRYCDELPQLIPEVSGWISLGDVRDVVEKLEKGFNSCVCNAPVLPIKDDFKYVSSKSYVYVKISEGCNNKCNYCAIPFIRGELKSRKVEDILDEVKFWLDKGALEINLIAQDVTAFGSDYGLEDGLLILLEEIEKIEGKFWVRILYAHPAGVDRRLVEFISTSSKCVPYIESPVQHISEKVLRVMGRKGGRSAVERVAQLVEEYKLFWRTTFLVGHPGEEDEDFEALLEFVENVRPWRVSLFSYSPEEGTVSSKFEPLEEKVVKERYNVLWETCERIMFERTAELIGKTFEAIAFEDCARVSLQAPEIDGLLFLEENCKGVVQVFITDSEGVDLYGKVSTGRAESSDNN